MVAWKLQIFLKMNVACFEIALGMWTCISIRHEFDQYIFIVSMMFIRFIDSTKEL